MNMVISEKEQEACKHDLEILRYEVCQYQE